MNAKVEAYLQVAGLSNLPTVWSNVLVGAALASLDTPIPIGTTLGAIVAISLFYVGGMAQNDLIDLRIDTEERPERPIPSGRLSKGEVRLFTIITFTIGLIIIGLTAPQAVPIALGLLVAINLYNLLHKKWTGSLVFMGLCRALVYCTAAAMIAQSFAKELPAFATLLALYIIVLTLIAQKEANGPLGYRRYLAIGIIILPFLAYFATDHPISEVLRAPGIVVLIWLIRSAYFIWSTPPKVVPAILGWLAGIALIDAYFLALLDRTDLAFIAVFCFIATTLGHRRILGT